MKTIVELTTEEKFSIAVIQVKSLTLEKEILEDESKLQLKRNILRGIHQQMQDQLNKIASTKNLDGKLNFEFDSMVFTFESQDPPQLDV